MKLYVKLRESGEVKKVNNYVWICHEDSTMQYILMDDCYLCDEQGRLLVPEQPATIPVSDALAFAMYYHSQMFMSNMQVISIAELYEYWNTNIKPQTT